MTVVLAHVLFPVVLLLGLTGLLVGILQSYDEFSIPALAPAVWNLVILVCSSRSTRNFDVKQRRLRVRDRMARRDDRADADGRLGAAPDRFPAAVRSTGTTPASSRCSC